LLRKAQKRYDKSSRSCDYTKIKSFWEVLGIFLKPSEKKVLFSQTITPLAQ